MVFILGIIPARGGSKGIPDKNIREVRGKPLLAYAIEAAKYSIIDDYIVSTDSQEIALCARRFGKTVKKLRPSALSSDTAKSIDVVKYELENYEKENNLKVDVIVLLQPTAPMRTAVDIDCALKIFLKSDSDSLISVYEATDVHPKKMYCFHKDKLSPILGGGNKPQRRQDYKPVYLLNGAIYISKREIIFENNSLINDNLASYIMPRERSVNIDEPYDLELAEWMMSRYIDE